MPRQPIPENKLDRMRELYDRGNLVTREIAIEVGVPRSSVIAYLNAWNRGFSSPSKYNASRLAKRGKDPTDYCSEIRESNRNRPENQIFAGYVTAGIDCSGKSRKNVAFEIGCDTDTLRLWSNGSAIPQGEKLRRVCEVLEIPYEWMKGFVGRKREKRTDRERVGVLEAFVG